MGTLHLLLVVYGLCFGLMQDKAKPLTDALKRLPWVGSFFERQLACAYCTGFHCGWVVFILESLRSGAGVAGYIELTFFAFASAAFCLLVDVLLEVAVARIPPATQGSRDV
jgi:hypothetical protein